MKKQKRLKVQQRVLEQESVSKVRRRQVLLRATSTPQDLAELPLVCEPLEDLKSSFPSLLEVFDDGDVPPLGVQTVGDQPAVPGRRDLQALQSSLPLAVPPLVGEVDRNCSLGQGELGRRAQPQVCGQFALDGSGALELVVDLHAHASPSLFELCGDVGRPLCRVGSDLSHLQERVTA